MALASSVPLRPLQSLQIRSSSYSLPGIPTNVKKDPRTWSGPPLSMTQPHLTNKQASNRTYPRITELGDDSINDSAISVSIPCTPSRPRSLLPYSLHRCCVNMTDSSEIRRQYFHSALLTLGRTARG